MTIAKLPGIRKAFERGLFTCSGVHNYFPSPVEVMIDAPDAYEFTSHRPFDRQRAMDMTCAPSTSPRNSARATSCCTWDRCR